ncbi:TIGR04063 family PEP-CTERM/XrtA system glycosyltransferase [Novosphingobium terrae]|uniref:TIGR04063 family PEP-CTERM/XrtA system glycosyltransferase n=1 Tax=Novosphingobium terrae TaxID=2726189 RepID=UPI001980F783|nr:TIGR04063 family PEP-CTERM/XrtA system glycosyltransferase [Novosphingobium terrae]
MTRVLHILDHSLPMHSGYTFRTRAIMTAQTALGLEVRGITGLRHTMDGPDTEEAERLTFHRTRGEAKGPPGLREWRETSLLADAIVALAQEWRPDVLHAHSPALCGLAGLRAARRLGIPLVYEIRAFWEDAAVGNGTGREGDLRYNLIRRLEDYIVARADAVVTICDGLKQDLVARGNDPERITIMPNGVDLTLFGTPPSRDENLARDLTLGSGPVIGFIGSFYDYEGLDDLIEAMRFLSETHPDARLLMVGGGPRAEALRAQAAASPVASMIRFVGRVPHGEVENYYALCDIMAYPRKKSRLTDLVTPLKPLEAMAQGKLVAASDVGGHRELIEDGVTGTLFPPDDPKACGEALAALLSDRSHWEERREAGRNHVAQAHDWHHNVSRYLDVYQNLRDPGNNGAHASGPQG